jgi:hypothetical protein
MRSVIISVAVGLLAFSIGLVGLYLKRRLPERHMSTGSRDMIGAIMGLLSLLLALVLGILVGSAHTFFASQKAELESLGSQSLALELALRQYGPETEPLRQMMKASVQEAYEAAQGNTRAYEQHFEIGSYLSKFEEWNDKLASLTPHTPQQTELLSSIRSISASFQQTRLLMSEQLASSISWPAPRDRRWVGASVVLRVRRDVEPQPDERRGARLRRVRGGDRDLSHSRAEPAFLRPLPSPDDVDRGDAESFGDGAREALRGPNPRLRARVAASAEGPAAVARLDCEATRRLKPRLENQRPIYTGTGPMRATPVAWVR